MATIESAATGVWATGATWVGGVAPNAAVDSVEIKSGHIITLSTTVSMLAVTDPVTVESGGGLIISAAGTLNIQGATASMVVQAGGTLTIAGKAEAKNLTSIVIQGTGIVQSGGVLAKSGSSDLCVDIGKLYILNGGTVTPDGVGALTIISAAGRIYHYSGATISLTGSSWLDLVAGKFYNYGGDIVFADGSGQFVCEPAAQMIFSRASKTMENATGTKMIEAPVSAPAIIWDW